MYRYEIAWNQFDKELKRNIYHFKGFKYREQFDRFVKRLNKRTDATILKMMIDFKVVPVS